MPQSWFCARIKTTIDWHIIIAHLRRQGFDGYQPVVSKSLYFAGKRLTGEWPLFENYLFVAFDMEAQRWRAVNSTTGIQYLLPMNSEFPLALPNGFVEELMTKKTETKQIELTKKYMANDIVKILAGAWKGQTGTVISSSRKLTKVDVSAFNGRVTATVATTDLAPG